MKVSISTNSWHFKLFSLIKRYQIFLSRKTDTPEKDPIDSMLLIKQSPLYNRLNDKWRLTLFNFRLHKDPLELLKLLFKRFLLYQFWGSGFAALLFLLIMFFTVGNGNIKTATIGVKIAFLLTAGGIQFFRLLYVALIIKFVWECLFGFIDIIKGKELSGFPVRAPRYFLVYMLSFIVLPIWIITEIVMSALVKLIMVSIWYSAMGIIWFVEILWLILNVFLLIVGGMMLLLYKCVTPVIKKLLPIISFPLKILGTKTQTK